MSLKAELLQLTQQFYAVAMSKGGWESALDPMVELLGADHAMIFASAPQAKTAAVAASARLHRSDFARFLSPEAGRLMAPSKSALPAGTATIGSQLTSERHFEKLGTL